MNVGKSEIVSLDAFLPFVEEMLENAFTVHRVWQASNKKAALDRLGGSVRGIVCLGHTLVDGELLDRLPNAKIVSLNSVGFDRIDLAALRARGVALANTPDVLTDDVADLAIGLTLAVSRRIAAGDRYVRSGEWLRGNMELARSLTGKTIGIFGLGRIGSAIARRAEALRMQVVYGVRARKPDAPWPYFGDLRAMAKACDVLVVSVPGGASTRHSVNSDVIEALGPAGILVNISRGSVVDEAALVDGLIAGRLGGAGLDVFEDEPRVPNALFGMDQVVLQPHVGSATLETRRRMAELMVENLVRHFSGKPLLTPVA